MLADQLLATSGQSVPRILVPNPWRDSLAAFLFGYAVTGGLLYLGLSWFGVLHPSHSQLEPRFVAVVDFIDSLFGWGIFLVPVSFSYRAVPSPFRQSILYLIASALGLVITGLETWVLLIDPRYRISATIYLAAGTLNALLATIVLLILRGISAQHNEN